MQVSCLLAGTPPDPLWHTAKVNGYTIRTIGGEKLVRPEQRTVGPNAQADDRLTEREEGGIPTFGLSDGRRRG